jgi:hypothetical protein
MDVVVVMDMQCCNGSSESGKFAQTVAFVGTIVSQSGEHSVLMHTLLWCLVVHPVSYFGFPNFFKEYCKHVVVIPECPMYSNVMCFLSLLHMHSLKLQC